MDEDYLTQREDKMLRKKILESSDNRRSARDRRNVEKKKTYICQSELSTGLKMPSFSLCALKLSEVAISSSTG